MSSCPELGQDLLKLEQLKRQRKFEQQIEPVIQKKSDDIFVKPSYQRKGKSLFIRAPSLDSGNSGFSGRQLQIPSTGAGALGRSPSPLGTTSSMRSALAGIKSQREDSPLSQKEESNVPVIRLRLRKQPSVDSGINLDAQVGFSELSFSSSPIGQLSLIRRSHWLTETTHIFPTQAARNIQHDIKQLSK